MTHSRLRNSSLRMLGALAAAVCTLPVGAAAATPSAPVGTQITYSDRICTVVNNAEGYVRCRLQSGEVYTRAFGMEIVGPLKPQGEFLSFLAQTSCAGTVTPVREIELARGAAKKLAEFWPLEVGKSTAYSIVQVTNGGFGDYEANGEFRIRAKVERRESVATPGGTFDAFVIAQIARASCDARRTTNNVAYERTIWFALTPGSSLRRRCGGPRARCMAATGLPSWWR